RIEDTDQERYVEGAEEDILESLEWAGVTVDEGPVQGGPHAPYHQSRRRELYGSYAQQLVDAGHAYYAFDTPDELDAMRARLQKAGEAAPKYDFDTRRSMRNSLTMDAGEVRRLI